MSQTQWILNRLKQGPVTAIDALDGCGCFRLAARINDLRLSGYDIETQTLELPNGKHVAQYHLKEKSHVLTQ
jgi:hypothetical protein